MATLLDVGLLKGLSSLFPLLLIFALTYAMLTRTDFFKTNKTLAAIVAIVLGFMGVLSPIASKTIQTAAPYFVILFVFAVFSFLVYSSFGISDSAIVQTLVGENYGTTFGLWMLALILIITIGSFSSVISEQKGFVGLREGNQTVSAPATGQSETQGFFNILVHPKILGLALILLTAMFAIKYLTEN